VSKIKIIDAKVNTKLIGDSGSKKPQQPSLREIVLQLIKEQREFNERIEDKVNNLDNKVDNLDNKVDNVIKLNNLKS
jgi:uncharacterized protein YlxW (UPF0749 family)